MAVLQARNMWVLSTFPLCVIAVVICTNAADILATVRYLKLRRKVLDSGSVHIVRCRMGEGENILIGCPSSSFRLKMETAPFTEALWVP